MNTTPFTYLLRRIAPGLLITSVVAFVLSFAFVYSGGEKVSCISGGIPALASILFLRYALRYAFFPVEDKTLSRISIIIWLVCTLSGLAGILLAYPLRMDQPEYSLSVIVSCMVLTSIVLSLHNRLSDYGRTQDSVLLLIYTQVLLVSVISNINLNQFEHHLSLINAVSFVICLLLLWEQFSPLTFADRITTTSYEFATPPLPTLVTNLVLLVSIAVGMVVIVVTEFRQIFSDMRVVSLILIGVSRAYYVCWRRNRASDLTREKAVFVTLAQLVLVGLPFRNYLGVKAGTPVRCSYCCQWRMAWMQDCPHCTSRKQVVSKPRRRWLESLNHDSTQCIFRVILGITFLFFVFFYTTATYQRDPRYFYPDSTTQEPISSITEAPQ